MSIISDQLHNSDPDPTEAPAVSKRRNTDEANDIQPAIQGDTLDGIPEQNTAEIDRNAILNDIAAYAISDTEIAAMFDEDANRYRKNPNSMSRTTVHLDDESIKNAEWVAYQYEGATRSAAIRVLICLGRRTVEHILAKKGTVKP